MLSLIAFADAFDTCGTSAPRTDGVLRVILKYGQLKMLPYSWGQPTLSCGKGGSQSPGYCKWPCMRRGHIGERDFHVFCVSWHCSFLPGSVNCGDELQYVLGGKDTLGTSS